LRRIETSFDVPLKSAVIVAFCELARVPAFTTNVVLAVPAGTVTEACTGNSALLLVRSTSAPPAVAGAFSFTVQVVCSADIKVVGVHDSESRTRCAMRERVAVFETPPNAAVRVAV
jgi:hypothetical protein